MLLVAVLAGLAVAGPKAPSIHTKGRLGFMALAISPELRAHLGAPDDRGVLVDGVRPDSPAAHAGVHVGDVVTEVDGAPARSASDVIQALSDRKTGDEVAIDAIRAGKRVELHARLESDPAPQATSSLALPDDLDSWLEFKGGDGDMRDIFEEMQRHLRELQQQVAAPRHDKI